MKCVRRIALSHALLLLAACGVSTASSSPTVTILDLGGRKVRLEVDAGARYDPRRTSSAYRTEVDSEGAARRTVIMKFGELDGRPIVVSDGQLTIGRSRYGEVRGGSVITIDLAGAVTIDGVARDGELLVAPPPGPSAGSRSDG